MIPMFPSHTRTQLRVVPLVPAIVLALLATTELQAQVASPFAPLPPAQGPAANPITLAKTNLGKALFWDEQISATRTVSCGTCHFPEAGGSDLRSVLGNPDSTHPGFDGLFGTADDVTGSAGVPNTLSDGSYAAVQFFGAAPQVTDRKAPTVINSGFAPELFWDGRAGFEFRDPATNAVVIPFGGALENVVLEPPLNTIEMGHIGRTWPQVTAELGTVRPLRLAVSVPVALSTWIAGRDYPALFLEAFGDNQITPTRVAFAIATYLRTLVSDQAPLDGVLAGTQTLTPLEQQGMALFQQLNCAFCHNGPTLADLRFNNTGVRPAVEDAGRGAFSGIQFDQGAFKTPSLRNVELRAPFFHNGSKATLRDVVDFYDRGGDFNSPQKSPLITPLGLTNQEKDALVAFLGRPLTDPRVKNATFPFDRPTLYIEGSNQPVRFGTGTAGSGGLVPRMIALEPAALGNPGFTVAVDGALGGAATLLVTDPVTAPTGFQVFGVQSHLALSPGLQLWAAGPMQGTGAGNGHNSMGFDLNLSPALLGAQISAQWLVADPMGPQQWAASAAATVTLF